jgi:hypothetical protein
MPVKMSVTVGTQLSRGNTQEIHQAGMIGRRGQATFSPVVRVEQFLSDFHRGAHDEGIVGME